MGIQGGLLPGGSVSIRGLHSVGFCIQWESASMGLCIGGVGRPPKIHGILWATVNKQAVRIILECILVTRDKNDDME